MDRIDSLPELPALADRIVFSRHRANLTQRELADVLQVSLRTVQNYESGATQMPASLVALLEVTARVPRGWILHDGPGIAPPPLPRRRRLGGKLGGLGSIFGATAILLFPAPSNALALGGCHCTGLFSARKPQVRSTHRSSRTRPTPGGVKPPDLSLFASQQPQEASYDHSP